MSSPQLRRQDRVLGEADTRDLIAKAYCGRLATVSSDGWPYVVPLLHVYSGDEIGLHNTAARGHLRANVEANARACFEVDEPMKVFDYGRFECDTGLAYRSAIAYGRIRVVDDRAAKIRFFDSLFAKYGTGVPGRPKSFYPRLDVVTVYALNVEHVTGKSCPLPPPAEQWPALDRTKVAERPSVSLSLRVERSAERTRSRAVPGALKHLLSFTELAVAQQHDRHNMPASLTLGGHHDQFL